jgi:hypothetical protein
VVAGLQQLIERLGHGDRDGAAAELLADGWKRQQRDEQPATKLPDLHD